MQSRGIAVQTDQPTCEIQHRVGIVLLCRYGGSIGALIGGKIGRITLGKSVIFAVSPKKNRFFSKMGEIGESALSEKAKKRYLCPENLERLEVLKGLSEKYGASIAAIIIGAFSSFETPEVFPVIGGSRLQQIEDSLDGADIKIQKSELVDIFKFDI